MSPFLKDKSPLCWAEKSYNARALGPDEVPGREMGGPVDLEGLDGDVPMGTEGGPLTGIGWEGVGGDRMGGALIGGGPRLGNPPGEGDPMGDPIGGPIRPGPPMGSAGDREGMGGPRPGEGTGGPRPGEGTGGPRVIGGPREGPPIDPPGIGGPRIPPGPLLSSFASARLGLLRSFVTVFFNLVPF